MLRTLEDVLAAIRRVYDRYELDKDRALRNERWDEAKAALMGQDACQRIENELRAAAGLVMSGKEPGDVMFTFPQVVKRWKRGQ